MSEIKIATDDMISQWADAGDRSVALHLRQTLVSVDGPGEAVIFPPTYAEIDYNIDTLPDGTKVAIIDSVGSQANRMEPIFLQPPYSSLVPKVEIDYGGPRPLLLLDAGHRLGDAVVRSSSLGANAQAAFKKFFDNDATGIAKLSPTSLVFGVWDSRDTGAKLPRVVQSVIRAWDVMRLRRSAQFNPALDYASLQVFSDEEKKKAEESGGKDPKAQRGFVHVPATGQPGGVFVRGAIVRQLTVNLVALRRLSAADDGAALRRYILGLALVVATAPLDPFLRQGCILTPDPQLPASWELISPDGIRLPVELSHAKALSFAQAAAKAFGVGPDRAEKFNKSAAQSDLGETKQAKASKAKA